MTTAAKCVQAKVGAKHDPSCVDESYDCQKRGAEHLAQGFERLDLYCLLACVCMLPLVPSCGLHTEQWHGVVTWLTMCSLCSFQVWLPNDARLTRYC